MFGLKVVMSVSMPYIALYIAISSMGVPPNFSSKKLTFAFLQIPPRISLFFFHFGYISQTLHGKLSFLFTFSRASLLFL